MTLLPSLNQLISLKGKQAHITGAAAGLGRTIAYGFAEAGADLELIGAGKGERGVRYKRSCGGFVIRKYQLEDCDRVLSVWAAASALAHPFLSQSFLEQERQEIQHVHLPQAETWVWEADGYVASFISLLGNEVGAIFVDPRFQRAGIGWALMDHARALRGELEVEVFRDNLIGRSFYARYGFEPMGQGVQEPTGLPIVRLRLAGDSP